jgi:hypothetical protein
LPKYLSQCTTSSQGMGLETWRSSIAEMEFGLSAGLTAH